MARLGYEVPWTLWMVTRMSALLSMVFDRVREAEEDEDRAIVDGDAGTLKEVVGLAIDVLSDVADTLHNAMEEARSPQKKAA